MNVFGQIALSTLSATALIGFVVWLSKNLILTRLQNSVAHEFNSKIENVKSELRSREAEIAAIREMAVSASTGRGREVDARKLKAIDDLWEGFLEAKKKSYVLHTMTSLNLDVLGKRVEESNVQEFIASIFPNAKDLASSWNLDQANSTQPWVSDLAWAYYSAYAAIVSYCLAWAQTATLGLDPQEFVSQKHVNELLAVAMPRVKIDAGKDNSALYKVAGEHLESELILELKEIIKGEQADQDAVLRAKKIMDAANNLDKDVEVGQRKAGEVKEGSDG